MCRMCGRRYWKIKALSSHLRLAHRPSRGSVEQHTVEISDHPASSCTESETAAPQVPGPVEPNVCSQPRRALDRVVVTVKSWLQNHPTVIWQPSASVIPQLRRVPGAEELPEDALLAVILTTRAFNPAKRSVSVGTEIDDTVDSCGGVPGFAVPPPHPEGRRNDCRLCIQKEEPRPPPKSTGRVHRRRRHHVSSSMPASSELTSPPPTRVRSVVHVVSTAADLQDAPDIELDFE